MEDSKGMIEEEEVAVEVASEEKDNTEKSLTQEEDFKVRTMIVEEEEEGAWRWFWRSRRL